VAEVSVGYVRPESFSSILLEFAGHFFFTWLLLHYPNGNEGGLVNRADC